MERQLKLNFCLSLKQMALRRLAVILWSNPNILASISKFPLLTLNIDVNKGETEWQETIEKKVKDNVSKLKLPKLLRKQLIDVIHPIGIEIIKWKDRQDKCFFDTSDEIFSLALLKLSWTAAGTIDDKKTAEKLIVCDAFEINIRYSLACAYCLDDYIPLLWEKLPNKWSYDKLQTYKLTDPSLKSCWPLILKGELSKLNYLLKKFDRKLTSFNQWAFEHSAEKCNKIATKYFYQQLTQKEREDSLMRSAHFVLNLMLSLRPFKFYGEFKPSEILFYFLSVMNPKQQMEIFESQPIEILLIFLDWPLQDLFLENLEIMWIFLSPSSYGILLQKMADRYTNSVFYLPHLFQEFFIRSPPNLKKCFVGQESDFNFICASTFLLRLFDSDDSETVRIIFRYLDSADRKKLVFHRYILEKFCHCMLKNRCHLVKVCLQEVKLSKEERKRLRDVFMNYIDRRHIMWKDLNVKRFFDFLGENDTNTVLGNKLCSII